MIPQVINCGEDNEHGKPAPDCFLAAAKQMGFDPSVCLVLEDAPAGVEAGIAAGMRVVAVPSINDKDAYPKPDPDCQAGEKCVLSLRNASASCTAHKSLFGNPWQRQAI